MMHPEYVSLAEVKRVCSELKLSDWTEISNGKVSIEDAAILLPLVNADGLEIEPEQFHKGLEVELEHGRQFAAYNITNNHPILTAKVVMAHFMESLDYYRLLDVAELEGDLLMALASKNIEKARSKYGKLAAAKIDLAASESKRLS